ncbi:hypothetical protein D3C71_1559980 [compost metagenome]
MARRARGGEADIPVASAPPGRPRQASAPHQQAGLSSAGRQARPLAPAGATPPSLPRTRPPSAAVRAPASPNRCPPRRKTPCRIRSRPIPPGAGNHRARDAPARWAARCPLPGSTPAPPTRTRPSTGHRDTPDHPCIARTPQSRHDEARPRHPAQAAPAAWPAWPGPMRRGRRCSGRTGLRRPRLRRPHQTRPRPDEYRHAPGLAHAAAPATRPSRQQCA